MVGITNNETPSRRDTMHAISLPAVSRAAESRLRRPASQKTLGRLRRTGGVSAVDISCQASKRQLVQAAGGTLLGVQS